MSLTTPESWLISKKDSDLKRHSQSSSWISRLVAILDMPGWSSRILSVFGFYCPVHKFRWIVVWCLRHLALNFLPNQYLVATYTLGNAVLDNGSKVAMSSRHHYISTYISSSSTKFSNSKNLSIKIFIEINFQNNNVDFIVGLCTKFYYHFLWHNSGTISLENNFPNSFQTKIILICPQCFNSLTTGPKCMLSSFAKHLCKISLGATKQNPSISK